MGNLGGGRRGDQERWAWENVHKHGQLLPASKPEGIMGGWGSACVKSERGVGSERERVVLGGGRRRNARLSAAPLTALLPPDRLSLLLALERQPLQAERSLF